MKPKEATYAEPPSSHRVDDKMLLCVVCTQLQADLTETMYWKPHSTYVKLPSVTRASPIITHRAHIAYDPLEHQQTHDDKDAQHEKEPGEEGLLCFVWTHGLAPVLTRRYGRCESLLQAYIKLASDRGIRWRYT